MRALPMLLPLAMLVATPAARAESAPLPEPPSNARPGDCYGLLYVPPVYETRTETVEIEPAGERIETVPAVYEWVEETQQVPARRIRRIVQPAKVETVEETVEVPARTRQVPVPATYRTVQERVPGEMVTVLKPGKGLPGQDQDGIFCLVEAPGSERVIEKRELVKPASSRSVTVPASSKVVRKSKVIEPAVTEWVELPPRTITRKVKKLVTPATTRRVPTPAKFGDVVRRVVTTPGHAEWQPILCADNLTPALLREVQRRLADKGLYEGAIDGRLGRGTDQAIRQFQTIEELPAGPLSVPTLQALGVRPAGGS